MTGKESVAELSRMARDAARISARMSGVALGAFNKDSSGVPMPLNGVFWSISHKPKVVAGVVSTVRIGLDIEQIKPVSDRLVHKILDSGELELFHHVEKSLAFFKGFTAKEAVLKKTGVGIRGLSDCKIIERVDEKKLLVQYLNHHYWVENYYFDGYLASVTKNSGDVQWTVV